MDFFCAEAKLAVELDGRQHGFGEQHVKDLEKESYLLSRGIVTKRFWNWQVRREPGVVKENLWRLLQERSPHPDNVPVTADARSRTWPVAPPEKPVPLRENRLPPKLR